jgi:hypothetical protein
VDDFLAAALVVVLLATFLSLVLFFNVVYQLLVRVLAFLVEKVNLLSKRTTTWLPPQCSSQKPWYFLRLGEAVNDDFPAFNVLVALAAADDGNDVDSLRCLLSW